MAKPTKEELEVLKLAKLARDSVRMRHAMEGKGLFTLIHEEVLRSGLKGKHKESLAQTLFLVFDLFPTTNDVKRQYF